MEPVISTVALFLVYEVLGVNLDVFHPDNCPNTCPHRGRPSKDNVISSLSWRGPSTESPGPQPSVWRSLRCQSWSQSSGQWTSSLSTPRSTQGTTYHDHRSDSGLPRHRLRYPPTSTKVQTSVPVVVTRTVDPCPDGRVLSTVVRIPDGLEC